MKPLTIEELKELKPLDYIYVVDEIKDFSTYAYKSDMPLGSNIRFLTFERDYYLNDYGTMWVAYKNKEQAEAKGEIVELPKPFIGEMQNGYNETMFFVYRSRIDVFCPAKDTFFTREEAEAKLAELIGDTQ